MNEEELLSFINKNGPVSIDSLVERESGVSKKLVKKYKKVEGDITCLVRKLAFDEGKILITKDWKLAIK